MRGLLSIFFAIALTSAASAATVDAVNGNVVVNGKAITSGGHDLDPVLSPDGKRVVFQRLTGGTPIEDCAADATTTKALELWTVNADGSGAKKLLGIKPDANVHKTICAFDRPQFSSNGQLLYFETPAWATSGAVHVYDFKTGKDRFFVAGNGVRVLTTCSDPQYRDHLVVSQHRYFVFGGSYDWLWLFSPAGEEVGPVGEDDAMLKDACS